jgi:hypothetical protein
MTQKLQDMTRLLMEQQSAPQTSPTKPAKEWACAHCHSDLHTGGMAACPLSDFKAKIARRLAKDATTKQKDEPGILERLIKEEKAKD